MSFTEQQRTGFFEAVESMKKYRRADLIDEGGRSLLEKLYTDLLPDEYILKKALLNNTTFFIGRKGTGKSTIFLRLEQELRKKDNYISCYLDVKTIFEKSQAHYSSIDKLKNIIPEELLQKYLIERTFIQNVLIAIHGEIDRKYDSFADKFAKVFITTKPEVVKEKINKLHKRIKDNENIDSIEIPLLKEISSKIKNGNEKSKENEFKVGGVEITGGIKADGIEGGIKTDSGYTWKKSETDTNEIENEFSTVFLQVFQITDIINEIKEILQILKIEHLFVLLDDFSEIDDHAIIRFVDVLLAPLNNWSDEFIKFKIAAYPGRMYYGKIDKGKVDTMYLDFYNLYSVFDRDKMEENATDFARRLVDIRIKYYTNSDTSTFFDTDSLSLEEYYSLFFKVSMNVPRILGYILSYCYESRIVYGRKISKIDIENASQRYYDNILLGFFDVTSHSLLSIDEKISVLQLKELLDKVCDKLQNVKKRIQSKDLTGASYVANSPFATHFYFNPELEEFFKTLELNFFVNKYNDMSDKDGAVSSVYCINYGLSRKLGLLWGKPDGRPYRSYFVERPFNFNSLIVSFLNNSKQIKCINPECNKEFAVDQLKFLEFTNFKCNECASPVEISSVSESIKAKIQSIDSSKLLPRPELKIIQILNTKDSLYAREIAQEIDYSGHLIGRRAKKLAEAGYLERSRETPNSSYQYSLTTSGKEYFTE